MRTNAPERTAASSAAASTARRPRARRSSVASARPPSDRPRPARRWRRDRHRHRRPAPRPSRRPRSSAPVSTRWSIRSRHEVPFDGRVARRGAMPRSAPRRRRHRARRTAVASSGVLASRDRPGGDHRRPTIPTIGSPVDGLDRPTSATLGVRTALALRGRGAREVVASRRPPSSRAAAPDRVRDAAAGDVEDHPARDGLVAARLAQDEAVADVERERRREADPDERLRRRDAGRRRRRADRSPRAPRRRREREGAASAERMRQPADRDEVRLEDVGGRPVPGPPEDVAAGDLDRGRGRRRSRRPARRPRRSERSLVALEAADAAPSTAGDRSRRRRPRRARRRSASRSRRSRHPRSGTPGRRTAAGVPARPAGVGAQHPRRARQRASWMPVAGRWPSTGDDRRVLERGAGEAFADIASGRASRRRSSTASDFVRATTAPSSAEDVDDRAGAPRTAASIPRRPRPRTGRGVPGRPPRASSERTARGPGRRRSRPRVPTAASSRRIRARS